MLRLARISHLVAPSSSPTACWLSASERARREGFTSPSRRLVFEAGRWLARCTVAERLGQPDPALIRLEIDDQGRSSAPPGPLLGLSIAHSQDWVACAVADSPVGVDIECLRPRSNLLAMAAMTNSPALCEELAGLPDEAQMLRFYQRWTLKEAWLKRQGQGLDFARMKAHELVEAGADKAQALSGCDQANGLVLALDGEGFEAVVWPVSIMAVQRWRYADESAA